MKEDRNK